MDTIAPTEPVPEPLTGFPVTLRAGVNRHAGTPTMARFRPGPAAIRCECLVCGSHAFATPGCVADPCGTCGSVDLRPVDGGPRVLVKSWWWD